MDLAPRPDPLSEGFTDLEGDESQEFDDRRPVGEPGLTATELPVAVRSRIGADLLGYLPLWEAPIHGSIPQMLTHGLRLLRIALG